MISPGNSTVEAGSTVVFACVGFGDPTPSVTWSTGGVQLSNNSRITIYEELVTENGVDFVQSILEICSAEEADGGQYSCTVGNALRNASVNFELSVTAAGGMTSQALSSLCNDSCRRTLYLCQLCFPVQRMCNNSKCNVFSSQTQLRL